MNELGISSVSSFYPTDLGSVYKTSQELPVIGERGSSAVDVESNPLTGEIQDEVFISAEAKQLAEQESPTISYGEPPVSGDVIKTEESADAASGQSDAATEGKQSQAEELTPEQMQEVAKLKARDIEVKAHEQAHISAAVGISVSGPTYVYQTGPDGKKYAVGGEVSISFTSGSDPEETIANAETMKAAALAPADPSSQDYSVARNAEKIIADAKDKLAQMQEQERAEKEVASKSNDLDGGSIMPASA